MPTELRALASLKEHLLFERRASFERSALALGLFGLAAGPVAGLWSPPGSAGVALVFALSALLFAPLVRGGEPVSGTLERVGLALVGAVAAWGLGPALGALVSAALFGVALVPGGSARLRLFAPVAAAAGLAWGMAVSHGLDRWGATVLSPLARCALAGACVGLLAGMGVLLLHLRWVDPVVGRLAQLPGSARVADLYRRCRTALRRGRAPVLDHLLEDVTREAGQLSERLDTATRALQRVDREEASKELERLRAMMASAEPRARQQLESAARAWSDALEQVQSMETARARLEASLLAHTAFLERAALGLESSGPHELGSLAERLAGQRPEPVRARAA